MEITVFSQAKEIAQGQIFIAKKDSVEGRDKAVIKSLVTSDESIKQIESDIRFIIKNHYEEMPAPMLREIHCIVNNWFTEKQIDEGLDAFDRRDK